MANPFKARFDSTCDSCGDQVLEGDDVYAVDGDFVCSACAEANDNVCDCGNYKKAEFEECFECHEDTKNMEGDSVNIF